MSNLPTKCYFLNILGHFYPFFFNTTYRMVAFAAVSFAEGITFGAWLRALAAPVANDGDETITAAGNSWGYGARTARINVSAVAPDGNAGFNMGVYNDVTMSLSAGDEANLWVKPLDIVKVSYGKYDNNTLRGDVCYGSWNWLRPTSSWIAEDEGLLMSGNGGTGLMAEITPMEELYIQVMAPITTEQVKAGTTYKNLRAGFAYTVPGTVKVKGQYIGKGASKVDESITINGVKYTSESAAEAALTDLFDALTDQDVNGDGNVDDDDFDEFFAQLVADGDVSEDAGSEANSNCTLEAEVDVLAVEGLTAGLGFQYNVVKDGKDLQADKMKVALYAAYQVMPELKVSASGAYYMNYDSKVDPMFDAGVGVDYDLGDGLAANADVRYRSKVGYDGDKVDDSDNLAFSVGLVKSVSSNGSIGVAFQGITNSGSLAGTADGTGVIGKTKDGDVKFVWAIPIALSVWF